MRRITHSFALNVRFNEVDSIGIVWHGHYLKYFEDGREDFGKRYGISYLSVQQAGFTTPVVISSIQHKNPLRYGDKAIIKTTWHDHPAAKMHFTYEIVNEETKQVIATGETIQVFCDAENKLCLYAPAFYLDWKNSIE